VRGDLQHGDHDDKGQAVRQRDKGEEYDDA
jgi:hypothetical protein